jgi:hypothetical protein
MSSTMLRKVSLAVVFVAAAGLGLGINPLSLSQEAKEKKTKGRLPQYYADIVTESQRQKIYAVQDKYAKQIADLVAQLAAVEKQRDTEIENLLSADQREQLTKAREDAAAKKKKAAEEKKKAEGGKTKSTQ